MKLGLSKDIESKLSRICGEYFGGEPSVSNVLAFNSAASVPETTKAPTLNIFAVASLGR